MGSLQEFVAAKAAELEVPGVAAGVLFEGEEHYAFHGVTSVENPLEVDEKTLFQFGSTGKTYTATALMRLVEEGKVDLDAPVRQYLPDFNLKDSSVAEAVTVLQLLNHTAGWQGDLMDNTGDGDDALALYVAKMVDLEQVTPLGATVSYNNASLSVAGLIIARIAGTTYEQAIRDLVLDPLGLKNTFFFMNEIMTRRFAVGHQKHDDDGRITIARPWALPRGNAPAGGMSATAADQLAWARFHLGNGTAPDGTKLLSAETVTLMQQATVECRGSAIGDAVGISWLLRDIDGQRIVMHGGTTNGQHSDFLMVPDRNFAVISMSNCGPNGPQLNDAIVKWALEHYVGIVDRDPEPVVLSDAELQQYLGRFETLAATVEITPDTGRLLAKVEMKPEARAVLREQGEDPDEEQPPIPIALLAHGGDEYIIPEGPAKGMKGFFTRASDGTVDAVHVGGRLATREPARPSA
jgi:CubicO group peptidase (beta-lactamase class C family)